MKNSDMKKIDLVPKWLIVATAIFLIAVFIFVVLLFLFDLKYNGKIYPNTYIGDINLSGLDFHQAKAKLGEKIEAYNRNGIVFRYGDREAEIFPLVSSANADIAYQIISFNVENSIQPAYLYGRGGSHIAKVWMKIKSLSGRRSVPLLFTANRQEIKSILIANFSGYETPAEDAKLIVTPSADEKSLVFSVADEKNGRKINYEQGINEMLSDLSVLNNSPIVLRVENDYPKILKKDCLNVGEQAQAIILLSPLKLTYGRNEVIIKKNSLSSLLGLEKNENINAANKITVGLDNAATKKYLADVIAPKINKEPVLPRFEIKNGKVTTFQLGVSGVKLEENESLSNVKIALQNGTSSAMLVVREIKSDMELATSTENFGIREIIGTGHSNFKGSPKNRRHNIATGANALNGVLIRPNEEFSLVKALGEIGSSTGYLPELVIKGKKTIPEFGGGLCQIGTTMFRTALSSGLPITERRNHSYRVVYYEPAGTDATIYDPKPDFKFSNDTGSHILIQKRIEGDNLYFDFWGTNDGRIATRTDPTIFNIVRPGPQKTIETLDLKPGEKKCVEAAHNGADAYFDYKVTYPDGQIKEKRFSSHYVPWQAVCLIGVEKLTTDNETEKSDIVPTSTN